MKEIILIKDGEIAQTGQHEQLLCQDGPYRSLYAMQLKEQREPGGSTEKEEAKS